MFLRISTLSPKTFEEYRYDISYCEDILGFLNIFLAFEESQAVRYGRDIIMERLELNKKTLKGLNYGKPIES